MDGIELVNVELLIDESNLEIDGTRRWQIHLDLIHIEPQEEALHLNAFQITNGAITQFSSDGLFVVDQVLELNVARALQNDDESTVVLDAVVSDCAG